jgi:hypothetical protein
MKVPSAQRDDEVTVTMDLLEAAPRRRNTLPVVHAHDPLPVSLMVKDRMDANAESQTGSAIPAPAGSSARTRRRRSRRIPRR